MKIVINRSYGGFGLSQEVIDMLYKRSPELRGVNIYALPNLRTLPLLIEAVETLGPKAGDYLADLKIINIPDDIEWEIRSYDGMEEVHEKHKVWY